MYNYLIFNALWKPATKIAASFETAKWNLLKDVKGFEKVRFGCSNGFVELDTTKGPITII